MAPPIPHIDTDTVPTVPPPYSIEELHDSDDFYHDKEASVPDNAVDYEGGSQIDYASPDIAIDDYEANNDSPIAISEELPPPPPEEIPPPSMEVVEEHEMPPSEESESAALVEEVEPTPEEEEASPEEVKEPPAR